jgi:hypothetical protein
MTMIKNLLDGLHHSEQIRNGDEQPSMTELMVTGVYVHHNLAIIEKGLNTEQGAPEWLRTIDHANSYTGEWWLDQLSMRPEHRGGVLQQLCLDSRDDQPAPWGWACSRTRLIAFGYSPAPARRSQG